MYKLSADFCKENILPINKRNRRYLRNTAIRDMKMHTSNLLWLYSLVCVGLGRKPHRLVFWQCSSIESDGIADNWLTSIWKAPKDVFEKIFNFCITDVKDSNTRFIQKVPGLGGYLQKLISFHPDISYTHFSSQF